MSGAKVSGVRTTLQEVHEGQELAPLVHDVTATTIVLGALASRDWRPMHHDHSFAVDRNGTRDIFMNTPTQAAWFERYLTDWAGPTGRLGRMRFRMLGSVFPGDTMVLAGVVRTVEIDATGCGWVAIDVTLKVADQTCTECAARVAIPTSPDDNPWDRRGTRWQP